MRPAYHLPCCQPCRHGDAQPDEPNRTRPGEPSTIGQTLGHTRFNVFNYIRYLDMIFGGDGGIRTLGRVAPTAV